MRVVRPLLLLGVIALLVAGCGKSSGDGAGLRDGDIAAIGSIHITRARFETMLDQARRAFKQQGRPFPKAGSREYAALKNQAVLVLVQAAQREIRAKEMGIVVTDKQVEARLDALKKQHFQGSDARYEKQIKAQGLTDEQVRADIKSTLINDAVFKQVTADVKVSDPDIHTYYQEHLENYQRPESREVRHILVKAKPLADEIYGKLRGGASFAALAKKHSTDGGTKDAGGKLTVARGQTVPEFDKTAFLLKTGEISKPVKTQYGWHVIEAIGKIKPKSTTPEKQVRDSIRDQLLQTKRNEAISDWVKETEKKLGGKVSYAAGFKPPKTATTASQ
jgi:parvulin-like peptidyl-prolyl isomerase